MACTEAGWGRRWCCWGAVEKYRSDGKGPPGYSPGVGQFESDVFDGLDNLYPGADCQSPVQGCLPVSQQHLPCSACIAAS